MAVTGSGGNPDAGAALSLLSMKPIIAFLCAGVLTAVSAQAMPARRVWVPVTDTEGRTVMVQRVGNAFTHRTIDADGREMVRLADGRYSALTDEQVAERQAARRKAVSRRAPGAIGTFPGSTFPAKGQQKAIVVLVEFQDQKMELGDHAHDYFTDMLNKDDFSEYDATGGVHKYFMDSSAGQFDCQFDLYGPVTLSKNMAYYGGNNATTGQDNHPEQMVIEACRALDAKVDFSQYDRDNDGIIDNVYLIYAGRGEASDIFEEFPETVWPHSADVSGYRIRLDGKLLATYGCSNEWEDVYEFTNNSAVKIGERPDGIGTFVHEFSHILGLPDLYNTVTNTYYTPAEWSVLDYGPYNNNGRTPPAYSSFERNALGWIDLKEITDATSDVTIGELNAANEAYCITNPKNSGEFYLFESRKRTGWDAYLPGEGMLVWHVDFDSDSWSANTVNNTNTHQRVDLVEADGRVNKTVRNGADPFPGTKNVTEYTPKWWTDGATGFTLSNIAAADGNVSFTVASTGGNINAEWMTVDQAINQPLTDGVVKVRGYIVGYIEGGTYSKGTVFSADKAPTTNILLADDAACTDYTKCIPVQLPTGAERDALNLSANPANLHRCVELTGTHTKYFSVPGLRNVTAHQFLDNNPDSGIDEINVDGASTVIYDLRGRRVSNPTRGLYIINGRKVLLK